MSATFMYGLVRRMCKRQRHANLPPRETIGKPIDTESFQKGEGDGKSTEQKHQIGNGMKSAAFGTVGILQCGLLSLMILGQNVLLLLLVVARAPRNIVIIRVICMLMAVLNDVLILLRDCTTIAVIMLLQSRLITM